MIDAWEIMVYGLGHLTCYSILLKSIEAGYELEDDGINSLPWVVDMPHQGSTFTGTAKLVDGKYVPHGIGRLSSYNSRFNKNVTEGQFKNGQKYGYQRYFYYLKKCGYNELVYFNEGKCKEKYTDISLTN